MNKKGFTLIELLVVIVIIGILVAIALPNFIKIKDKAREAEVKQNLHSIQLAVERYGTDEDGNYPYYLFGGDTRFNIGTHDAVANKQSINYPTVGHPFDMFNLNLDPPKWCYQRMGGDFNNLLDDNLEAGFGDTLSYEGYLPKYPGNPFVTGKGAQQYSWEFLPYGMPAVMCSGFGGYDGTCMWNLGWWGDWFYLHKFGITGTTTVINDFAGQFFYHPRWQDGVTNLGHLSKQADAINNSGGFQALSYADYGTSPALPFGRDADKNDVSSLDVAAYDLIAIGSPRTKGQDIDNSGYIFPDSPDQFRTGYITQAQERNPWIAQGEDPWNAGRDYAERPFSDGKPDFIIIHLSSGIDKKVVNEIDK